MDEFDKLIKEKAKNETWRIPEDIDKSINLNLNNIKNKKIKTAKNYKRKRSAMAAAILLIFTLSCGTIFVHAEEIKNVIQGTIAFFNKDNDLKYASDKTSFDKFNKEIGLTTEDNGIRLTIDNIAVDDNFLNIFYTIEGENLLEKVDKDSSFAANFAAPFLECKLNGEHMTMGNNNDRDAYFESDNIIKVMDRVNISLMDLPSEFKIELSTEEICENKGQWYISTMLNKEDAEINSITVTPNKIMNFDIDNINHEVTVDKVSISPFGSQIVLSEYVEDSRLFNNFALFDDKGKSLDVLDTDLCSLSSYYKTTNSFEFLKADSDIKYIEIVPIKTECYTAETNPRHQIIQNINDDMEFKLSDIGSITINNIEINDNTIKVSYIKQGILLLEPDFDFYDEDGNEIEWENGECSLERAIDRKDGVYTAIYKTRVKNEELSKIKKIGTISQEGQTLLEDQKVRIDLK